MFDALCTGWLGSYFAWGRDWLLPPSSKRARLSNTFTKPLSSFPSCLPSLSGTCGNSVELDKSVEDALVYVADNIDRQSNPAERLPFGVASRLSRGGKTVLLRNIYSALRAADYNTMLISFNFVNPGFCRRNGESDCAALYRVIASQLTTDGTYEADSNEECDWEALSAHIGSKHFVLLIDEINALGSTISSSLSDILKKYFLDIKGRCIIVTTHVPVYLTGFRTNYYITMPMGCDLKQLQAMHPLGQGDRNCNAITPCAVAYYLGIPSLLYLAFVGKSTSESSVETRFAHIGFESNRPTAIYAKFVDALLSGDPSSKDLKVYHSLSTIAQDGKILFPLCYVNCIVTRFNHYSVSNVQRCIQALDYQTGCFKDGKAWETVVSIAMLLRMEDAIHNSAKAGPFNICSCGWAYGARIHLYNISNDAKNTLQAKPQIDDFVSKLEPSCRHLVWCIPQHQGFEQYDGFAIVVDTGCRLQSVIGVQIKEGRAGAGSRPIPAFVTRSIHLRGHARPTSTHTGKWEYKTQTDLFEFLGYSLSPLLPALYQQS